MKIETRYDANPKDAKYYDTKRLRSEYLQETIFSEGEINLTYTHVDRMIFGGVMPKGDKLEIGSGEALNSETFLKDREMGVINISGSGSIVADGEKYSLAEKEGLYVGRGTKKVVFETDDSVNCSKFYICCAPAHKTYPTRKITLDQASPVNLGSSKQSNKRTIYKYLHPAVLETCQLTLGMTVLEPGNIWNTMPCHTHERRMEVYFYFGMDKESSVFHFMGEPDETRHIVVKNEQAVISPSWSIHSGCGTGSYTFIWGMAGENKTFDDMDGVGPAELK